VSAEFAYPHVTVTQVDTGICTKKDGRLEAFEA
jgi:hypothetical protein